MAKASKTTTVFLFTDFVDKHPCSQGCPDRSGECHSTCKRYLEYERKHQARKRLWEKRG